MAMKIFFLIYLTHLQNIYSLELLNFAHAILSIVNILSNMYNKWIKILYSHTMTVLKKLQERGGN